MTDQKARAHINGAFALWWERSTREWSLDLSMLPTAGVTLAPPPGSSDRTHIPSKPSAIFTARANKTKSDNPLLLVLRWVVDAAPLGVQLSPAAKNDVSVAPRKMNRGRSPR
jgi:hypothetical protein